MDDHNETEIAAIRDFKKETNFSSTDIAKLLHVDKYVIRSMLRGEVEHLKRRTDGFILNPGSYRYFVDIDIMIHCKHSETQRPVRRDGRMLIAGWKKTDGGCLPDIKELPYYMRCEK